MKLDIPINENQICFTLIKMVIMFRRASEEASIIYGFGDHICLTRHQERASDCVCITLEKIIPQNLETPFLMFQGALAHHLF